MIRNSPITAERLREFLDYDPATGVLTWRVRVSNRHPGTVAGTRDKKGYVQLELDRWRFFAHRVIWCWMTGNWPIDQIDHVNRIPGDNRWCNLREANSSQNRGNMIKFRRNTSGFKGVSWHIQSGRWQAKVSQTVDGKRKHTHLGYFADPAEAHEAYKLAAAAYFGEFFNPG